MNRREAMQSLAAAGALACLGNAGALAQEPAGSQTTKVAPPASTAAQTVAAGPAIWMNQCGYLPDAPKVATVVLPAAGNNGASSGGGNGASIGGADAAAFVVIDAASGSVVLHGELSPAKEDAASGDCVALADFSAVRTPGSYRLRAAGVTSDPVAIGFAVYADALRVAMRSYYGQRCGHKVNLGGGYKHGKCHKHGSYHPSSGKSGKVKQSGGWHDAGDYGRYVVNSGITTGMLLWTWELFPAVTRDLRLDIPESGRGLPDFLAEVRWNLRWMLSMQDAADGGVWHKQTSEHFCAFIAPDKDKLPSEIIGTGTAPFKSTYATADFAAVMAIAARCYGPYDARFAADCLAAARKAYAWAESNPDVIFRNPPGVSTGEYGSRHSVGERMWAAAELYRTTGDAQFAAAFQAGLPAEIVVASPSWGDLMPMALWTFCLGGHAVDAALKERIVAATTAAAAKQIARATASGYGNTLAPAGYVWGSNAIAANDSLLLCIADRLQPNPAARAAALGNLHYLLGRNCFGVSWVTQVGVRPFQHPHHRPSVADKIAAPWPGLLSGGPNAGGGDPVANAMPTTPPMRHWVDDWRAYSLNEVAINWNAPLVFLLAAANSAAMLS